MSDKFYRGKGPEASDSPYDDSRRKTTLKAISEENETGFCAPLGKGWRNPRSWRDVLKSSRVVIVIDHTPIPLESGGDAHGWRIIRAGVGPGPPG